MENILLGNSLKKTNDFTLFEDTNSNTIEDENFINLEDSTLNTSDVSNIKLLDKNNKKFKKNLKRGALSILGISFFSFGCIYLYDNFNKYDFLNTFSNFKPLESKLSNKITENLKIQKNKKINIEVSNEQVSVLDIECDSLSQKLIAFKRKEIFKHKPEVKKTIDRVHVVTKGDTLYEIGLKYNIPYNKIMRFNNLKTSNLKIGSTLNIDKQVQVLAKSKPIVKKNILAKSNKKLQKIDSIEKKSIKKLFSNNKKKTLIAKNASKKIFTKTHKVKKGDTLYTIAKQNGLNYKKLMQYNNLKTTHINIGDNLQF